MGEVKKQLPLATFRIATDKAELWESFKAKADANKTTGAALFWQFVQNYVDGVDTGIDASVDSNLDERIDRVVSNAIAPLLARLEALETSTSEAAAPANFSQALIQKAIKSAPQKLMEVA